jgi:hypothetical protein
MEKGCAIVIRKVLNGFIVSRYAGSDATYMHGELVFETIEKLNAFLTEHYKD